MPKDRFINGFIGQPESSLYIGAARMSSSWSRDWNASASEHADTVCWIVNDLFLKGVSDDQMRHQPKEGLNSMAWYLWHTARWQDFANTLIAAERSQVLNEQWLERMNVPRCDVGTGMTREECSAFNDAISLEGLRAYWKAVSDAVREVARSIPAGELAKPVDTQRLQLTDGTIANEHAGCLRSWRARPKAGFYQWRCGTRPSIYLEVSST